MNKLEICRLTVITGNKPIFYTHHGNTLGGGCVIKIIDSFDEFEVWGIPSSIINAAEYREMKDEERVKLNEESERILARVSKKSTTVVDYY